MTDDWSNGSDSFYDGESDKENVRSPFSQGQSPAKANLPSHESTPKAASQPATSKKRGASRGDGTDGPPRQRAKTHAPSYFDMRKQKKNLPDRKIHEEVESRRHETPEQAVAQEERDRAAAAENGEDDPDWQEDYVVAVTKDRKKAVIKYTSYSRPSLVPLQPHFDPTKSDLKAHPKLFNYYEQWYREMVKEKVREQLLKEMSQKQLRERYPHQFAVDEEGHCMYITNEINLKKHRLRAFESKVCYEANEVNLPNLHFEDWTGATGVQLPLFNFTHLLRPSKKVANALAKTNDYGGIKCKKSDICHRACHCKSVVVGYPSPTEQTGCGCKVIVRSTDGKEKVDKSPVECTEDCGCEDRNCDNRVIQRGRQVPLLIWRDYRKGWTVRALTMIKKGEYVSDYTGEVLTHYESTQREDHTYYLEMPCVREIEGEGEKGKPRLMKKLVVDSAIWGNETRFISHSCDPNLVLVSSYVERAGGWYSRMAFVAKKDIKIGEELTFDYFPKCKSSKSINHLFEKCLCGSDLCHFKDKLEGEDARIQAAYLDGSHARAQKEEEREKGDPWPEGEEEEEMPKERKSRGTRYEDRRKNQEDPLDKMGEKSVNGEEVGKMEDGEEDREMEDEDEEDGMDDEEEEGEDGEEEEEIEMEDGEEGEEGEMEGEEEEDEEDGEEGGEEEEMEEELIYVD